MRIEIAKVKLYIYRDFETHQLQQPQHGTCNTLNTK